MNSSEWVDSSLLSFLKFACSGSSLWKRLGARKGRVGVVGQVGVLMGV